ncbi:MAG: DNA mismatch repair protein MutS [Clostridia bacterium]|nr:DNA mismatch repair protein MutS [Clostridia bacterium]
MNVVSPMMKHYLETKNKYRDCFLFYRLGDFYEMFFDDAILASKELEITLTGKDCGLPERAPMCGIPFHAAETYTAKLIEKGYKVAICEQLEDPAKCKGIVKRDVIRVITPGTVIESNMLNEKENNYIMSIYQKGLYYGISVCDMTTGDFYASDIKETNNFQILLDEIARYNPAEIITNDLFFGMQQEIAEIKERFEVYISRVDNELFSEDSSELMKLFTFTDNFGNSIDKLEEKNLLIGSVNALLEYLNNTQKVKLEHINTIKIYDINKYMALDINARRHLELTEKMRDKTKKGTLLWVLDRTSTSMGGRQLKRWISNPLLSVERINDRLHAVQELKDNLMLRDDIKEALKKVYDIERLIGKIAFGNANARDLISLKTSLSQLPEIKQILAQVSSGLLKALYDELDELEDVTKLIEISIVDEPPITITDGGIIKLGYNSDVDMYRKSTTEGKTWLVELEAKEKQETGIKNLKVSYNKVFGYYIEVTKSNLNLVPDRYIRKQTLTNGERYITEELKELEQQILGAQDKVVDLEYNLFIEIRQKISKQIERIQQTANVISTLDVLVSFAEVASDLNYIMPIMDENGEIDIKDGRHPVIEKMLPKGEFVANDTYLNKDSDRFSIITGPNMAGKSTYMRQVALICIMAQIGSFVPASYAKIGIVDKVFTRVGASDDLSMGQSTFMVEMNEVATILKNATCNSLVVLDEIGRGTSTYDGLAIAWAVVEYMADKEKVGCKTLFATHYHELTELEEKLEGVKNYSVAVKEKGEDVIFLRKIIPGGTDESYGIHVAKLAGVPRPITKRANEILRTLERKIKINSEPKANTKVVSGQLDMYNYKLADIAHELDKVNLNELTPIDALNILVKLKEKL